MKRATIEALKFKPFIVYHDKVTKLNVYLKVKYVDDNDKWVDAIRLDEDITLLPVKYDINFFNAERNPGSYQLGAVKMNALVDGFCDHLTREMYNIQIYIQLAKVGLRKCIHCTPEDQRTVKLKGARYFLYLFLDWIKLLLGGVRR